MLLLFVVTLTSAKLKSFCPTMQVYETRCMVFSLLCYHISFTQVPNQDLLSFCQNVITVSHMYIKTT